MPASLSSCRHTLCHKHVVWCFCEFLRNRWSVSVLLQCTSAETQHSYLISLSAFTVCLTQTHISVQLIGNKHFWCGSQVTRSSLHLNVLRTLRFLEESPLRWVQSHMYMHVLYVSFLHFFANEGMKKFELIDRFLFAQTHTEATCFAFLCLIHLRFLLNHEQFNCNEIDRCYHQVTTATWFYNPKSAL